MISLLRLLDMSKALDDWQNDIDGMDFRSGIEYKSKIKSKLKDAKSEIDSCITQVEGFN